MLQRFMINRLLSTLSQFLGCVLVDCLLNLPDSEDYSGVAKCYNEVGHKWCKAPVEIRKGSSLDGAGILNRY